MCQFLFICNFAAKTYRCRVLVHFLRRRLSFNGFRDNGAISSAVLLLPVRAHGKRHRRYLAATAPAATAPSCVSYLVCNSGDEGCRIPYHAPTARPRLRGMTNTAVVVWFLRLHPLKPHSAPFPPLVLTSHHHSCTHRSDDPEYHLSRRLPTGTNDHRALLGAPRLLILALVLRRKVWRHLRRMLVGARP